MWCVPALCGQEHCNSSNLIMYLEVYVFNSPVVTEEQVYDEETLPVFPHPDILKKKIEDHVPGIKWLDAETGRIDTSDHQGQLILGNDQKTIYFRITGGNDPFKLILDLCQANNWASYTPENGHFLDKNLDTVKYWQEYRIYKGIIDDVFYKGRDDD